MAQASPGRPSIFITGAAAGIGRATAERFSRAGWFVGLYDVNEAGVRDLAGQLEPAVAGSLDVTDAGAYAIALEAFFSAAGGRLDLLFNNAGIVTIGDFEQVPLARHHAVVDVNFKGVINGCHLALPYLKRTPGARVISMCSASALYGSPPFTVYGASKFAVRGFTEALNVEWARHGITVMDVLPLFVDTPMVRGFESAPQSMERLGLRLQADDIARTVWQAAQWADRRWSWPRVHWLPGLQTWALYLSAKFLPVWLNRWTTRLVTGY